MPRDRLLSGLHSDRPLSDRPLSDRPLSDRLLSDRRVFLTLLAGAVAGPALSSADPARAQAPAMSRITAFAFHFAGLSGGDIQLAEYAGKPILVVNTASQCGYTPQYAGLQELWKRYRDRGLLIVGVPSNDFGGQEPGTAADIAETAQHQYGASFPITAKAEVRGPNSHPFYKWAVGQRPLDPPRWNFHKYLIGRDGLIVASFASDIEPTDARVVAAIERQLK
jgi:glutathione peroxidase